MQFTGVILSQGQQTINVNDETALSFARFSLLLIRSIFGYEKDLIKLVSADYFNLSEMH